MSIKSVSRYKKTWNNAGGKPTRGFSLQHKTFRALNYAQDFGTTVKESRKRTTNSKWATLTKSRIVPCQILTLKAQRVTRDQPSRLQQKRSHGIPFIVTYNPPSPYLNKIITKYSRLQITRTLANSNLALTRTKIDFPWISVIHSL